MWSDGLSSFINNIPWMRQCFSKIITKSFVVYIVVVVYLAYMFQCTSNRVRYFPGC